MATLATQQITPAGITPAYVTAAGGGDKVQPADGRFIHVKNGGGSPITVTIDDPTSVGPSGAQSFNPDLSVVVGDGDEAMIGPINARYTQVSDGFANITYSDVTSVTIGAFGV